MSHPGDVHVANQPNEMRRWILDVRKYIPRAKARNEGTEEACPSPRRLGIQGDLRRKRPGQKKLAQFQEGLIRIIPILQEPVSADNGKVNKS